MPAAGCGPSCLAHMEKFIRIMPADVLINWRVRCENSNSPFFLKLRQNILKENFTLKTMVTLVFHENGSKNKKTDMLRVAVCLFSLFCRICAEESRSQLKTSVMLCSSLADCQSCVQTSLHCGWCSYQGICTQSNRCKEPAPNSSGFITTRVSILNFSKILHFIENFLKKIPKFHLRGSFQK